MMKGGKEKNEVGESDTTFNNLMIHIRVARSAWQKWLNA